MKDSPINLAIPPHNVSNSKFAWLHYSLSSRLTTLQVIYKHYMRALAQWPKDALRPECRFEDVIQKRIEQKFNPPKPAEGAKPVAAVPINEKAEMDQVNALLSLLGNRYTKRVSEKLLPNTSPMLTLELQFPLSDSLMKPASNPTHYTDLVEELLAAPNRSWFERLVGRWRKSIRLQ